MSASDIALDAKPNVDPPKLLPESSWTEADEARAKRKIDLSVLPLLCLGLLVFQFDRMNLASALTDGFADQAGIDQDTINLGNQLLFLGTVALEIPSNMLLQKASKIGPRKWISSQVLLFGLVGTMQIFIRNKPGYIASRLCLGLAESGYIPGSIFTISTWYTKRERARRVAIFFFGMFGGNAISPLLASGILKLGGTGGLKGWQWLFLIEGLFTFCVAGMFFFLLPGSPDMPKPLIGNGGPLVKFTDDDRHILVERLILDGNPPSAKSKSSSPKSQGMHIPLSVVWKTVKHHRRWPHFVSTFCVFSTWSPLTTYTPSIIMSFGFDRIEANALAAVGASLAPIIAFGFAWFSDHTNRRGLAVISAQLCYLVALVVGRTVQPAVGTWGHWGLWTAINAFAVAYHPAHNTWLQLNCHGAEERSISIAMWVMSANTGMMVGTWYYRANDKARKGVYSGSEVLVTPHSTYDTGLLTQIGMVAVGIAFALLQEGIYVVHNRRVEVAGQKATISSLEPRSSGANQTDKVGIQEKVFEDDGHAETGDGTSSKKEKVLVMYVP
ncbi:inner membrane transporter yfaV [Apodospora peruviana]|uniref:Inner membrane transporter yfaV n=1 Tax=Apodospora peruviana TaxID=516989 RepID=A0AAE0M2R9_9PEZI|nr:inner membrane transporter yfaV [Apodospora peruviana]